MTKKYILKPGRHQFAPGSAAVHDNNNLTDAEARWYLKRYPHIASLFIDKPASPDKKRKRKTLVHKVSNGLPINNLPTQQIIKNENLSPAN